MTRLPSASTHERALACPASEALPHAPRTSSPAADAGTARHEALAAWLLRGERPADESVAKWLEDVAEEAEALRGYEVELTLAYDYAFDAARVLGADLRRDYSAAEAGEYVGTADYLDYKGEEGSDAEIIIVDLKTGRGEVTHPEANAQLLSLAVMASRAYRRTRVKAGLLLAPDGGPVRWQWATYDAARLDAHAEALALLALRIAEAREDVAAGRTPRHLATGPQCQWCPARESCPALGALVRGVVERPAETSQTWRQMLREGKAADVLRLWRVAKEALDEVGAALHAHAAESPIPVGPGRVWGPHEVRRDEYDAEVVWRKLEATHGAPVAREAMTLSTSKAGIQRAAAKVAEEAKARGEKVTKAGAGRVLLALCEEARTVRTTTRHEEYAVGAVTTDEEAPQ